MGKKNRGSCLRRKNQITFAILIKTFKQNKQSIINKKGGKNKKMPKKQAKKASKTPKGMPKDITPQPSAFCHCKTALAVLIVILVWTSAATWSKVVITIAAILIIVLMKRPRKNKQVK